ncbi:MAG: UDP-N-acetylmuramate dehydrogenase [Prevotella sp.]|nr:UDP-N-acetylmuramate dehydrogenase [Prevotella sp.]
MVDKHDYSLFAHNTFGIDVKCRRFVEYSSVEEAQEVARQLQEPYLLIGAGSNLLLTQDFDGTVVHSTIKGIETQQDSRIRCGSGEMWDGVVAWCVGHGLYGAENLSLIPGEVGASAVQNIGAYGAEVKDLIETVEAVEIGSGKLCVFSREECQYGYRDSRFKHEWKNKYLITHVVYRLSSDESRQSTEYGNIRSELDRRGIQTPTAAQLRQVVIDIRNAKLPDPKVTGNAGSFFMNPVVSRQKFEQLLAEYPDMPHYYIDADHEKIPAGWMIDQCGWKGRSLGRAGVHDRQALVLINRGGATGQEIVTLCETIRKDIRERFGIDIHPEVNII